MVAWVNGRVTSDPNNHVSITDPGLLVGHGVFETTVVVRSQPLALARHLDRLHHSAELARVPVPLSDADLATACADAIEEFILRGGPSDPASPAGNAHAQGGFGRLRLTVTAGGLVSVIVAWAPPWPATTSVALVNAPINEHSPLVGAKTLSHLEPTWCWLAAQDLGVGEVIRTNTAGVLCEGGSTNLFMVLDGQLVTPALSTGCLPGITRALVMELTNASERDDLSPSDLTRAEEVFITSSTRGVHPVSAIGGRELGAPGQHTVDAAQHYHQLLASTTNP